VRSRKRQKQSFRYLKHSILMIQRNRLVYTKLSVTVVLSFSLLLAFLSFTDARLYNEYKEIFAQPREIVQSNIYGKPTAFRALLSQIKKNITGADCYGYATLGGYCEYVNGYVNVSCSFLPAGDMPVYRWYNIDFEKTSGLCTAAPIGLSGEKQDFDLKENEVIINESWYNALIDGGAQSPLRILIHFDWQDGKSCDWVLTAVGVCNDTFEEKLLLDKDGSVYGWGKMYLSAGLLSREDVGEFSTSAEYSVWVNTATPEKAIAYARALGFWTYGVSEAQKAANDLLAIEKANKAYIAAVILVLLGINLYSSFTNALQERRYEIGVKRALGAGKGHIVRQFLYESLCVLLFDTLLSATLVIDLMIGYKAYQAFVLGKEWIVYISPYSVIMFLVCSLSLSMVFSLMFAFQSTQVEIISNLREE